MLTSASDLSLPARKARKGLIPSGIYGKGFPNGRESKDYNSRNIATSLHDVAFLLSKIKNK